MQAVLCHISGVRKVVDDYKCPDKTALQQIYKLVSSRKVECRVTSKPSQHDPDVIEIHLKHDDDDDVSGDGDDDEHHKQRRSLPLCEQLEEVLLSLNFDEVAT